MSSPPREKDPRESLKRLSKGKNTDRPRREATQGVPGVHGCEALACTSVSELAAPVRADPSRNLPGGLVCAERVEGGVYRVVGWRNETHFFEKEICKEVLQADRFDTHRL